MKYFVCHTAFRLYKFAYFISQRSIKVDLNIMSTNKKLINEKHF